MVKRCVLFKLVHVFTYKTIFFVLDSAPIVSVPQPSTSGDSCHSFKDATMRPSTINLNLSPVNEPKDSLRAGLCMFVYVVVLQTFPKRNPEDVEC